MTQPQLILLLSGKRKCGKDYICEKIKSTLGDQCTILRISGPLKHLYAKKHNLNFEELLSDGLYKEKYRRDMIEWSDKVRLVEPGYFCKAACENAKLTPVWMVSDVRRKTDIEWFKTEFGSKIKLVRVDAEQETREARGWVFTPGVDDVTSECDLDDFIGWDLRIKNNNEEETKEGLDKIFTIINGT